MTSTSLERRSWGPGSSIDRVRSAIEQLGLAPTKTGDDFHVECPAHDERTASLHIWYRDGRTRLHCFGCAADEMQLAEALGLGLVDLYDDPPECTRCGGGIRHDDWRECPSRDQRSLSSSKTPTARTASSERPPARAPRLGPLPKALAPRPEPDHEHELQRVLAYSYCDEQGSVVQQVHRYRCARDGCSHKEFRQTFIDRTGDEVTKKPRGWTPVLYRLPDVVRTVTDGEPVWLVEGEKDADTAVERYEVVATTNAEGAGSFPSTLAAGLAGADVRVVLDRDRAGYQRGVDLHQVLGSVQRRDGHGQVRPTRVRLLLPAVVEAKADLTDHADAGYELKDLVDVEVEELRAWVAAEQVRVGVEGRTGVRACRDEAGLQVERAAATGSSKAATQHRANAARWAAEAVRRYGQLREPARAAHVAGGATETAWGAEAVQLAATLLEQAHQMVLDAHDLAQVPCPTITSPADVVAGTAGLDDSTGPSPARSAGVARSAASGSGTGLGKGLRVGPDENATADDGAGDDEGDNGADAVPANVVDHPTRAREVRPAHMIPMSRGSWCFDTGEGERRRGVYIKHDGGWVWVAPLPQVRARIVRRDGRGRRCGTDYLIAADHTSDPVIVDHYALRDGTWANHLGMTLSADDKVVQAAATAVRQHAETAPEHEAVARIGSTGAVDVPVDDTLPGGYLRTTDLARVEALQVWTQIAELAAQSPRIALTLGAAAAAPWVKALGRQSHFVALYGDSDRGKTVTLTLAASIWGDYDGGVLHSWNTSAIGVGRHLGELGILPPFLDEAGMAPLKRSADWGRLIYQICEGSQRMTAEARGPGVRVSAPWHGILVSAGNGRMTADLGAGPFAGVAKRVVDLPAPFTHSAEQAEQLKALVPLAYGHAGRELLSRFDVDQVRELVDQAQDALGLPEGGNARTIARHLHAHVAGAAMLDRIAGSGTLLQDAAAEAAAEYLAEWAQPEHDADRVLRQVTDSIAREPARWPTVSEYQEAQLPRPDIVPGHGPTPGRVALPQHGMDRSLAGIRDDEGGWVAVFAKPWREMCESEEVDQSVACRELHARGVLLVTESRRRAGKWVVQVKATGTSMYKLDLLAAAASDDDDDQPTAPTPGGPAPLPTHGSDQPQLITDSDPVWGAGAVADEAIADVTAPLAGVATGSGGTATGTATAAGTPDPALVAPRLHPGCTTVAPQVAPANVALTCEVAPVARDPRKHLRVHAREVAVPVPVPAGEDSAASGVGSTAAEAPPSSVTDRDDPLVDVEDLGEGLGGDLAKQEEDEVVPWTLVEFVDLDGVRRRGRTAPAAECLGCGASAVHRFDGQPWHPLHWEATTSDQRAALDPAPVPDPAPSASELAEVADELTTLTAARTAHQQPRPEGAQQHPGRGAGSSGQHSSPTTNTTASAAAAAVATSRPVAAVVVDVDGVWMPDGSRQDLPFPIEHLGHLEQLGRQLQLHVPGLGWRTTPSAGQVVPTTALWRQLGVPVDDVPTSHDKRSRWLKEASIGLPALLAACDQGWVFGRGDGPPQLRGLIRLRRQDADRGQIAVVYTPALDPTLPALRGDVAPAALARRLQLFADVVGIPFAGSPISTAMDLLSIVMPRKHRERWEPVDYSEIEPARLVALEPDFDWHRAVSAAEQDLGYAHYYDRNGSYLAACSSTLFGLGTPEHHPEGLRFDPKRAGWWKIEIPSSSNRFAPEVLDPHGKDAGQIRWVTTPALAYAAAQADSSIGPDVQVLEAWVWPVERSVRALEAWYRKIAQARRELQAIGDGDARAVEQLLKPLYKHTAGWFISRDAKGSAAYQPYWHHAIKAAARVAVAHTVLAIGRQSDTWPLAVSNIDALLYGSDEPDPAAAWPGVDDEHGKLAAKLGSQLGGFKPYRSAAMADMVDVLARPGPFAGRETLVDVRDWQHAMAGTSTQDVASDEDGES